MTITNVTPTGDTNQEPTTQQPIDNLGNPIDDNGNPVEKKVEGAAEGETLESLQKALKDTKAELTRLQQEKAGKKADEGEGDETITLQTSPKEAAAAEAKAEVEAKGLDFDKYTQEINADGELSEESYAELAAKGFPKEMVDAYVSGQQAKVDAQTKEVSTVIGGEQNLEPVLTWAANNLSAEEIQIYNQAVGMSTAAAKMALAGIYAAYTQANGKAPTLINTGSPATTSDVFKSSHDMTKAMQDPRYWNDPDYQKEVIAKAERSQRAGTI